MKPAILERARARRRSAGLGIVTAVFLLVVIAGLGVAVVSMLTTQQTKAVQDELGARAYQAARAGTEWALYQVLQVGGSSNPNQLGCAKDFDHSYSFGFPAGGSLNGFTTTVTCGSPTTLNGANHYWIRATACNEPVANASGSLSCPNSVSPSPDYVQRVVEVQL